MGPAQYAAFFLQRIKGAFRKNPSPWTLPALCLRGIRTLASSERRRVHLALAAKHEFAESQDSALYDLWVKHHTPQHRQLRKMADSVHTMRTRPRFSILLPVQRLPDQWLNNSIQSVLSQVYPLWELFIVGIGLSEHTLRAAGEEGARDGRIRIVEYDGELFSAALNEALSSCTGEFVCLLYPGDELAPEALFEAAGTVNKNPAADLVYSDEDRLDDFGRRHKPFFKPDWSPEYLESFNYVRHLACFRVSLAREVGGFRLGTPGATEHDFLLRLAERTAHIDHMPLVLYHSRTPEAPPAVAHKDHQAMMEALAERLGRMHLRGAVAASDSLPGCFDVRHDVQGSPLVSIIIPTAGRTATINGKDVDLLANCIRSITEKSTYKTFEIIVVDNDDLCEETLDRIRYANCRFVHYRERFNIARKMNLGACAAQGEYLLFLNDDTEVISPDWITVMLQLAQRQEIGVVGAKLFFEDSTIQHMGVAFNDDGFPDHICSGFPHSFPGYFFSASVNCNYLAVTGACLMTGRHVFERVGGFNEEFVVNYNDVDYCLRVWESGLRIVFTPHAKLFHFESRNRERVVDPVELELFKKLWSQKTKRDPYYSFHLESKPPHFHVKHVSRYC